MAQASVVPKLSFFGNRFQNCKTLVLSQIATKSFQTFPEFFFSILTKLVTVSGF